MSGSGDYISSNAAIEAMYKDAEAHQDHTFWTSQNWALRNIPAADARPVRRGKWNIVKLPPDPGYKAKECSSCKCNFWDLEEWNFCPNCGADMREERRMYDELVKRLKEDKSWVEQGTTQTEHEIAEHIQQAADSIEELLDFAHFVASNVVVSDEEWDNNMLVFPEVASRKLNKLGIVEKDGACWSYESPNEET